jgi:2-oxoglutarate ferredoxin oxidoreductase subunit alpha
MAKILMKGNEAIAEAAVLAGCNLFAGYPITPQNQIPEYMSWRLPQAGGTFIQAESEVAAINMVFGAGVAGARAMTSSSSPGISLKQEGISYMAGCEVPGVIVNIMRGGPGLGNIAGTQADYFQSTRGGGHGDYRTIVLAPSSVEESALLTQEAFDLADIYRTPVIVLGDGILGQLMEPIEFKKPPKRELPEKKWALTGCKGREKQVIRTLLMSPGDLEKFNLRLEKKYQKIKDTEVKFEEYKTNDADVVLVAFGTVARICKEVVEVARENKIKVGLFRPITLWPFPEKQISNLSNGKRKFLVVEMNLGQMIDDVRLAINGKSDVGFYGRSGSGVPTTEEIIEKIKGML